MRTVLIAGMMLAAALANSPASAADISAEAGFVSDYRYRGLSLSNANPAIQGSVTVEHDSGAYGDIFVSTVSDEDGSGVELDVTAGYAHDLGGNLTFGLSASFFSYPRQSELNYWEATASLSAARGPVTATLGWSFAPAQSALRNDAGDERANLYLFTGVAIAPPNVPLSLKAQLGYERGPFDEREHGGKTDWSIGAEGSFDRVRLGVDYVGSNAGAEGVILSASLAF